MAQDLSFDNFIKERRYLHNVSPRTEEWYRGAYRWLKPHLPPTKDSLKEFVISMREGGLCPTSCNDYIKAVNAYLKWGNLSHLRLGRLKEEQRVLPTFTPEQIHLLMSYRPTSYPSRRLHTLILLLLDTGVRIEEAIQLRRGDVDLDNFLLLVRGKGRKERRVPFSLEGRKHLYKWLQTAEVGPLLFPTRSGGQMLRTNVLRMVKRLCRRLGFEPPERTLHAMRHSFACTYLRNGGNLEYLRRILGHTQLSTTQKYLRSLGVEDLKEVHDRLSPLAPEHLRRGRQL